MGDDGSRGRLRTFEEDYAHALDSYFAEGGEKWLNEAHELGRRALSLGIGVLDLVTIHEAAAAPTSREEGWDFLREALSPFEMTHRGFAEANAELRDLNDSLQRLVEQRTGDLREQQRLSQALNDINDLMRSRHGSEQIMCEVFVGGAETVGADSGSVAVADGSEWVIRYVWGRKPDIVGRRFSNEQNPWTNLAVEEGRPVVAEDAEWTSQEHEAGSSGPSSTVAAPIMVRDRTIAVLHFNHEGGSRGFSQVEVDFVEKLASSLSLALRDVLSFEAEHRIAEVLQEAILETRSEVEGVEIGFCYASSTEEARVGGDFYDVFNVQSGEVCLLIGDVSGKGIEAASVAAMTKNTIRVHSVEGRSPRDILSMANDSLYRFTARDTFISVFLALLNLSTGQLCYASAGHPPPILIRAGGKPALLTTEGATGPILAAFRSSGYAERCCRLKPDDVLVLYTDGVTESRSDGRLLGEEGFRDLLRPERAEDPTALLDVALEDVRRRAAGRLNDDIAMVAVRFEGVASSSD